MSEIARAAERAPAETEALHDLPNIRVGKGKVSNTFLDGEAAEVPPVEELRQRYGFLAAAMKKVPMFSDPHLIDKGLLRYHERREDTASATFSGDELPGWRLMILQRHWRGVRFAGVRDDGIMEQGAIRHENYETSIERMRAIDVARQISSFFAETGGHEGAKAQTRDHERYRESWKDAVGVPWEVSWESWLPLSPYSNTTSDAVGREALANTLWLTDFLERERFDGKMPSHESSDRYEASEGDEGAKAENPKQASHRLFKLLQVAITRSVGRQRGAMAANAMRALDKDVSKALHAALEPNMRAANWVSGVTWSEEQGRHIDPTIARNRQQALKAYPLLASSFIKGDLKAQSVIDEGKDLSGHLAQEFDVPRALVRRLSGLTWQRVGRYAHHDPRLFVTCLAATDLNHLPQSRRGFADMRVAYSAAVKVSDKIGVDEREMMKTVAGRFSGVAAQIEGNPPEGIADLDKDIRARILIPAVVQREVASGSEKEAAILLSKKYTAVGYEMYRGAAMLGGNILAGHTLRSALKASERWHRALPRINEQIGDGSQFGDPRNNSWEPLVGELPLKGGLRAVELSSVDALKHEGLTQNHCVGGYASSVKAGTCIIFSIRAGDRILSTAEISIKEGAEGRTEFSLGQNYAEGNETPEPAAQAAGHQLLKGVQKTDQAKIHSYKREMDSIRTANREEALCQNAGYDIFDRKGLENAFGTLREYLPKAAAKLSLDEWTQQIVEGKPTPRRQKRSRFIALHR